MPNANKNSLALRRKHFGYEQKQIAELLGNKPIQQISRYETGARVPSIKTAIKFAIIYKLPVRVLFDNYFRECEAELKTKLETSGLRNRFDPESLQANEYCSYLELLKKETLRATESDMIRRHIKVLVEERSHKMPEN